MTKADVQSPCLRHVIYVYVFKSRQRLLLVVVLLLLLLVRLASYHAMEDSHS